MGKFTVDFSPHLKSVFNGLGRYHPNFKDISNTLNALEGTTYILKMEEIFSANTSSNLWRIEAENDNVMDGSSIIAKYKIISQGGINGVIQQRVFDGIDIIDPPQAPAIQSSSSSISNAPPSGWFLPAGVYNNAGIPVPNNVPININIAPPIIKCVCGAESVGGPHSNYCGKR
jgi:hypothetical protein